jgi:tetratricopeptide repeat protein
MLERRSVEVASTTGEMTAERPREAAAAAAVPPPTPPVLRAERSREFPVPPAAHRDDPPRTRRSRAFPLGIAAGVALIAAVAAFALLSGGDDEGSGGKPSADAGKGEKPKVETTSTEVTTTETTTAPAPTDDAGAGAQPVSTGGGDDPALGAELNDQGYAKLQAGDPEGALPILQKAVAAFPEDSTDINYAYALFNYAQALRLTGDPASAIPLLQKRLAISDEQVDTVQAELDAAEAAAGEGEAPKVPAEPEEPTEKAPPTPPGLDGEVPPGHGGPGPG